MKTALHFPLRICLVVLLAGVLSTACQDEKTTVSPVQSSSSIQSADASCFIYIYFHTVTPNYKNSWATSGCQYWPGAFCMKTYRLIKYICWINWDWFKDVCLSCPYDIYKRLPREVIPDFRQGLEANPAIRWSDQAAYFPITKGTIGIQFYAANQFLTSQSFTLKSELILSTEMQQQLGVVGQKIPAGTYPVAFNEKTKTFNAIVAVR